MKILSVIRTLVETKLRHVISFHAKVRISPHSGTSSDIWSERSMRQSFFLHATVYDDRGGNCVCRGQQRFEQDRC
jgi:hypothetical protein